jgi:hypothetical protein
MDLSQVSRTAILLLICRALQGKIISLGILVD